MKVAAAFAWRVMLCCAMMPGRWCLADGDSLHSLIDQRLVPFSGLQPARCTDAEFLRRATLDLIGMPPTAEEARAFIADPAPDKREKLVDRLFASPHFARHFATALDLMLMERRANTHVTADEWQAWLLRSVRENKPWNVLAREILQADGDDPAHRPPARFALDRASEAHLLTRDIGRIFFGRDMQCAQCHDHPLVGDYLQSDYHGLLAFVSPSYAIVRKEGDKQTTLQAEKAGGDLMFESVFVGVPHRTGPRVPDNVEIEEPFFLPGEEYQVAPADNVKSVPKVSRRAKMAELATNGSNAAFNENIVNRLWAHMFGRGLVHPLDMHHPDNPATDPELLQLLSERFVAMNYDMRGFLRELAISNTYQRSFDPPAEVLPIASRVAVEVKPLEEQRNKSKQEFDSSTDLYSSASDAWQEAEAALLPVAAELDATRAKYTEAKAKFDEAAKAHADVAAQLDAKQKAVTPVQQAATVAQQAAQAIPDDTVLATAAQTLKARSDELATEIATLVKSVEEKSAALTPPTDALASAKPPVEAALAKLTPLKAAELEAEKAMLATRRDAAIKEEALAALDRRIATVQLIAKLAELDQAVAATKQSVPIRETELATAKQKLSDYGAVIPQQESNVQSATDALAAAAIALNAARAEHESRTAVVQAMSSAIESIGSARQKLPADAVLADVVTKLQERINLSQSETGQSQQQLDAAGAGHKSAEELLVSAQKLLADAVAERTAREQAVAAAGEALAAATASVSAKQSELDSAIAELTERWTNNFTVASLKPLTPEQLCWTVFRVTGVYDRYWQTEVAELDKAKPLTDEQKQDPAQIAARNVELEQRTFDKLKGNLGTFVAFYGAAAGQPQGDFFSTADQALFAANGGAVNSWVAPAAENVTDRITKLEDLRVAAEELYLSVLTRPPTEEERTEVVAYLTNRVSDKNVAAQELVWGLLNSAEFRFNH